MTSISDTAQREADEAEREDADLDETTHDPIGGDGDDEPGAEPVAVSLTPAEVEKRLAKLRRQAELHTKRVAEIMGDDFAYLVPSPVDWTPGFIFSPDVMPLDPEQIAELDAILGRATRGEFAEAKDAQACDTCRALGQVLTGSKVPGNETKPCGDCQGSGWRMKLAVVPQMPQFPVGPKDSPYGQIVPNGVQVADTWGRPFGHPHYGIDPSQVGV